MILSRLPVVQVFPHLLPWPVDLQHASMQRGLLEAVIEVPFGAARILTTHLEYYSAQQRTAQVERIRLIHAEAAKRALHEPPAAKSDGPFRPMQRAASAILTGDFNFKPEDPLHARVADRFEEAVPALCDAWEVRHPGRAHPVSLGLFDREQWPDGGYCSDFVYVTEDLRAMVADVVVDQATDASDHQPVILTLKR
jgi:endonuclease/exonuclease/phosphatase family metal-dependent hydrolase